MKKRPIKCLLTAVMPDVEYTLYHSREKLERDMKSRDIEVVLKDCPGQTFTVKLDGADVSIVLMDMNMISPDEPLVHQLSLLVHEATHIVNNYFEDIGETDPGEEENAYVTQYVSDGLISCHLKWLDKHNRKNRKGGKK